MFEVDVREHVMAALTMFMRAVLELYAFAVVPGG